MKNIITVNFDLCYSMSCGVECWHDKIFINMIDIMTQATLHVSDVKVW